LGSEGRVCVFKVGAKAAGGEAVGADVCEVVARGDVLGAFLLTAGQFLHDGLLADGDCFRTIDLLEDVLLLVDHSVEDHLQVIVVLVVLLLDVLN
jgi:hypothetical protein